MVPVRLFVTENNRWRYKMSVRPYIIENTMWRYVRLNDIVIGQKMVPVRLHYTS